MDERTIKYVIKDFKEEDISYKNTLFIYVGSKSIRVDKKKLNDGEQSIHFDILLDCLIVTSREWNEDIIVPYDKIDMMHSKHEEFTGGYEAPESHLVD